MKIAIPLDTDSRNTNTSAELDVCRGINRPENVVLQLSDSDRRIEVNLSDLRKALAMISPN